MGGMYGSAWRDGVMLSEAVEVSGNVAVNRVEVALVGQTRTGYKAGRETREGTMRIQKIDSYWEKEIFTFLSQSLAQRREVRGTPEATVRSFTLKVEIDDPEAYGYEAWQMEGVQIWQMPIGFSINDDIIEREFPITWESETPLNAFVHDAKTGNNTVWAGG
jgi:hypothetical protein